MRKGPPCWYPNPPPGKSCTPPPYRPCRRRGVHRGSTGLPPSLAADRPSASGSPPPASTPSAAGPRAMRGDRPSALLATQSMIQFRIPQCSRFPNLQNPKAINRNCNCRLLFEALARVPRNTARIKYRGSYAKRQGDCSHMSGTDRNQLHGAGGWCTRITAAEVTREAKIISAESIGQQFVR
jgi:hypothetical protein